MNVLTHGCFAIYLIHAAPRSSAHDAQSGAKTSPPRWSSTRRDKKDWPNGEVGILRQAWLHYGLDSCIFLFIEHNGHQYGRCISIIPDSAMKSIQSKNLILAGQ